MATILQLDQDELSTVLSAEIKKCIHEYFVEFKIIPVPEPLSDRITLEDAKKITGFSDSKIYKMTMTGSD